MIDAPVISHWRNIYFRPEGHGLVCGNHHHALQPDDYQQLNEKIQFFLDNPARLRRMQVPHLPHDVPHASSYLVKP